MFTSHLRQLDGKQQLLWVLSPLCVQHAYFLVAEAGLPTVGIMAGSPVRTQQAPQAAWRVDHQPQRFMCTCGPNPSPTLDIAIFKPFFTRLQPSESPHPQGDGSEW